MKKELTAETTKWIVIVFGVIVIANFIVVFAFPSGYESVGLIDLNVSTDPEKAWAFRGQVGDIFAGHFTALSMLFLFYGLMLQRESVEQMGESIKQQSKALINQQEEIKLQTKALTAQIEEMKAQKKEFETSNLQNRFQKYIERIDELTVSVSYTYIVVAQIREDDIKSLVSLKTHFGNITSDLGSQLDPLFSYCEFVAIQLDKLAPGQTISQEYEREFSLRLKQMNFLNLVNIYALYLMKHDGYAEASSELLGGAISGDVYEEVQLILQKALQENGEYKEYNAELMKELNTAGLTKTVFPNVYKHIN